ncbi:unnamed protein product [Lactuca virosa]|uniref:Uncharacterized protein n=1 Tax=Lactuca virosa TaxID=75947 RepID=A0AAU9NU80_9ASTR|nr:unnamed protein product [Lactuca virosa]
MARAQDLRCETWKCNLHSVFSFCWIFVVFPKYRLRFLLKISSSKSYSSFQLEKVPDLDAGNALFWEPPLDILSESRISSGLKVCEISIPSQSTTCTTTPLKFKPDELFGSASLIPFRREHLDAVPTSSERLRKQ